MNGRTALVTGGSRGIGAAVVERLTGLGAHVLAPARAELDLADAAAIDAYVAGLNEPVDILVNDAAVNPLSALEETSDELLAETLATNLLAPFKLCRALAPAMAARGYGRIVNVSSVWGLVGKPRRLPYTISKAALNGLTMALAVEMAPHGVLVNAVAPGFVMTEMTKRNNSPEDLQAVVAQIPLGRLAQPAEIAELVCFLCSPRNSFMTGQVIACDGGYTCL